MDIGPTNIDINVKIDRHISDDWNDDFMVIVVGSMCTYCMCGWIEEDHHVIMVYHCSY